MSEEPEDPRFALEGVDLEVNLDRNDDGAILVERINQIPHLRLIFEFPDGTSEANIAMPELERLLP